MNKNFALSLVAYYIALQVGSIADAMITVQKPGKLPKQMVGSQRELLEKKIYIAIGKTISSGQGGFLYGYLAKNYIAHNHFVNSNDLEDLKNGTKQIREKYLARSSGDAEVGGGIIDLKFEELVDLINMGSIVQDYIKSVDYGNVKVVLRAKLKRQVKACEIKMDSFKEYNTENILIIVTLSDSKALIGATIFPVQ